MVKVTRTCRNNESTAIAGAQRKGYQGQLVGSNMENSCVCPQAGYGVRTYFKDALQWGENDCAVFTGSGCMPPCQHELRNCHLAVSVKQWDGGNLHSSGRFWVKSWTDLTCSPPLKIINIHSVAIRLMWTNPFVIKSRFWTRFCRFQLSNVWYMDHVNIGIWKIEFPQQFCDTQRYHHPHPYWHRTVHLILWRMFSLHSLPTSPCCTTTSKPHAAAPKAKGWLEGHY